jgi:hypothetical protein
LAVVVKHGIEGDADGPYGFTSPALWNSIYARWWKPRNEQPGTNPVPDSPLPWTGDYRDGLGNRIRMLAYANPSFESPRPRELRADGYGIVRFNKSTRTISFDCWSIFANVDDGPQAQFPGWPITVAIADNDGRTPTHWLPEQTFEVPNPVVQVIRDADKEILYTRRIQGKRFRPPVFGPGRYTLRAGKDRPERVRLQGGLAEQ